MKKRIFLGAITARAVPGELRWPNSSSAECGS